MIDIKAFTEEDGTAVKIKELNGSINEIIEETAATVATIVMNIYMQRGPEDIRPKEYEAFIMQEMIKRIKEAVKQIQTGEKELKEQPKKKCKTIGDIIEARNNGIDIQPDDEKKGFLN